MMCKMFSLRAPIFYVVGGVTQILRNGSKQRNFKKFILHGRGGGWGLENGRSLSNLNSRVVEREVGNPNEL